MMMSVVMPEPQMVIGPGKLALRNRLVHDCGTAAIDGRGEQLTRCGHQGARANQQCL
jgi:hypothetical protein